MIKISIVNQLRILLALLVLLFLPFKLAASETEVATCRDWQSADIERGDLFVGAIDVRADDIFTTDDEGKNSWGRQLINRLHKKTDDRVLAAHVLFAEGDVFDYRKLEESGRYIRSRRYIREASVKPVRICGNTVDIEVRSVDNWTLTPGISASRSGGKSRSGISLVEHNLLGRGKSLSFSYEQDHDRDSAEIAYEDPLFLGTHKKLNLALSDHSDGEGYWLDFGLPFYQLDSEKAWGIALEHSREQVSLYQEGEINSKIGRKFSTANAFYGWSAGRENNHVERFKAGWQFRQKDYYTTETMPAVGDGNTESYPWLGYEFTNDNYIRRENFQTMGKVEDIQLGQQFSANLGVLHRQFGADDNYLRLEARYKKGIAPASDKLGLFSIGATSYLGTGDLSGETLSLQGEWFDYNGKRSSRYLAAAFNLATNLQPDEQILLGGRSGLRGYPDGMQSGNKSLLFTAEQRFYFDWHPFQLLKTGAVIFTDAGTAWGAGNKRELLGDVGFGLRLVPTRSSSGSILHIDFAVPAKIEGDMDDYQVIVESKTSF